MRYKVVPTPADRTLLLAVHDTLPLVPDSVEDCCTHIRDGTDVPSRDDARAWLTFAQAVGLAVETSRGYHRVREVPDDDTLADSFVENVFAVRELLDAVASADEPVDAETAFESVRDTVPKWERDRYADWESEWTDRVGHLLDWGGEFGLVERREGGYVPVDEKPGAAGFSSPGP